MQGAGQNPGAASAITFQRRSAMSGIGIALFLAAAMLFLYEFFPTLALSLIHI